MVWDWSIAIKGLQPEAQLEVQEVNYTKAGYEVTPSGNPVDAGGDGTSYHGTVQTGTVIAGYTIDDVITQKNQATFPLFDTGASQKIFIARLNAQHGGANYPLIITKTRLSLSERAYLENTLRTVPFSNAEYWLGPAPNKPIYYSFGQEDMLVIRGQRVTYTEEDGNPMSGEIEFLDQRQWTMVAVTSIRYQEGRPADFNFVNSYTERTTGIDIVKVDSTGRTKKVPGAIFTLTQLDETTRPGHIVYKHKDSAPDELEKQVESPATDGDGETAFSGLYSGYYEIKETKVPDGYILQGECCIYVKVDDGVAYYLAVDEDETKPITEWAAIEQTDNDDLIQFTLGTADNQLTAGDETTNTLFSIGNTPGAALPSTGGPGTHLFYLLGILLAILACAGWVRRDV